METTFPKRKPTRLDSYSYSNVGYYFITICAENKEKLFGTIVGGGAFDAPQVQLSEIGETVDDYIKTTNRISGVLVDKYVIMPNHLQQYNPTAAIIASNHSKECYYERRTHEHQC